MSAAGVARLHGGPDRAGAARWDFSTCANGAGPCPAACLMVEVANVTRYPDPVHHALRERLAALHGVASARILLAASASEFIQRITAVGARLAPGPVSVPRHAYGDYACSAAAWGRSVEGEAAAPPSATLRWHAEPSSPLGRDAAPPVDPERIPSVLDAVYAPLRLHGTGLWTDADRDRVFVLHSPNKALGLCGVRGAYAVAPAYAAWDVDAWCDALEAAAPSWPLSAHAEAMLASWASTPVQAWIVTSHATLLEWKARLADALGRRGFALCTSVTPFFCVQPPVPLDPLQLRAAGIAVRDAASFGLPGWWRVAAQPPAAIDALGRALDALLVEHRP